MTDEELRQVQYIDWIVDVPVVMLRQETCGSPTVFNPLIERWTSLS